MICPGLGHDPAYIDEKTSVIYKIQKPIPMFQVDNADINKPKPADEYEDKHNENHKRNPTLDRNHIDLAEYKKHNERR